MKDASHGGGGQHPAHHSDALHAPLTTSQLVKGKSRKCSAHHANRHLGYRQAQQAACRSSLVPASELATKGEDTPLSLAVGLGRTWHGAAL